MLQVYDQIKRMANAVVDAWDDTNHLLRTSATIDVTTVDIAQEAGGNLEAAATVLGAKTGAALDADGTGTIQQYLRGLLKAFLARIPTLGPQTAAGSVSVTPAVDAVATIMAAVVMDQNRLSSVVDLRGKSFWHVDLAAASATTSAARRQVRTRTRMSGSRTMGTSLRLKPSPTTRPAQAQRRHTRQSSVAATISATVPS